MLGACCAAAAGPSFVNHDAAWYLYMVQRWLEGARLYVDVVDTNPPLIVWITAIPALIARATGLAAPAVFKMFVFAVAALSLLAVRRLVQRHWPGREFVLVLGATFLSLPFVKADFGQREHFAVLLTLPYVLAAAAGGAAPRAWTRWLAGLAGGLGFGLKPHFLLAWLAVEIVVLTGRGRHAWKRPEVFAAAAGLVAYGGLVLLTAGAYLQVARDVGDVYGGLNSAPAVLLRLREVQLWIVAAAVFAAIRQSPGDRLPAVLFAAATGYLLAALLQLKGWGYHLYPARAFVLLFLLASAASILERLPAAASLLRGGYRGLAAVFGAALLVASVRYVAEARTPATPDLVTPFVRAVRTHAPGGPVAVLSMRTLIYPAFPAVNYAPASWSLRHNSLWFLQGFYAGQDLRAGGPLQAHHPDAMAPRERKFFDEIVHDLCASPPRLLAIEQPAPAAPAGRRALDLRAYYAQSPRAQRLFGAYSPVEEIGPFTLFTPSGQPGCYP
jgi:hypothetical protein